MLENLIISSFVRVLEKAYGKIDAADKMRKLGKKIAKSELSCFDELVAGFKLGLKGEEVSPLQLTKEVEKVRQKKEIRIKTKRYPVIDNRIQEVWTAESLEDGALSFGGTEIEAKKRLKEKIEWVTNKAIEFKEEE